MTTSTAPHRSATTQSALLAQVQAHRLLDRSPAAYVPRAATIAALTAAGIVAFFRIGDSWWQLALAAWFAALFAQIGFLGHDAGHQQIFHSRRSNKAVGLMLSNLGIGLSYGWWVDKHNRHHRHVNDIDRDPDVARNVLAWTQGQAQQQRGIARVIAAHQGWFFVPLLFLEAVNLHIGSVRKLASRPREGLGEATLLLLHVAGCATLLLLVLSPLKALAFVGVQQGLFGLYLGGSFAPNHKGMPLYDGAVPPDFFQRQVASSRNVRGGRTLSVLLGGLNYQIEHHLFPSMPSHRLRRCQTLVKEHCAQRGVNYTETSLLASYGLALRHLNRITPEPAKA